MDPWTLIPAFGAIALVFVVTPVGFAAFTHWRRPFRVACPGAGVEAQIGVNARHAALSEILGGDRLALEACSLWPAHGGCRSECLTRPHGRMRPVHRGEPPSRARTSARTATILVPIHGTPADDGVLDALAALTRARPANVHFVHVARPPDTVRAADGRIVAFAHEETDRVEWRMQGVFKQLGRRLPGTAVDGSVRFGESVDEIVREAERVGADLIVIDAGRAGIGRRVLGGGVAARLGRRTLIPLLLVPPGGRRID
jgi:nucleotide-binding universal stress UspA family protein